jgi:membrane-associated protein
MISEIIKFLHDLTDPDQLIGLLSTVFSGWWAYALLFGIVFAETGLLVGFVLPGDSLLFTLGIVAGAGELDVVLLIILLCTAAILGDSFGYMLGRRTGPMIFSRPDSRFFKKEYVHKTQMFFEKYGGKTIIYARFLPVIRSFAPFMAGVGNMNYNRFLMFNVVGAVIWTVSLTLAGYFLGNIPVVKANFEKVILAIILLSFTPMFLEVLRAWKKRRQDRNALIKE